MKDTTFQLMVITYGELNSGELTSFIIGESEATLATAKALAREFIKVIPDDPEDYQDDIAKWNGLKPLAILHQDDDFFFFNITVSHLYGPDPDPEDDLAAFRKFVADHNADPGED